MTGYMIFLRGVYLGVIRADSRDDAIDLAAVRFNGGDDTAIRVAIEGDF